MDYRKYLAKTESMILPYLGGLTVMAPDRRLRVSERVVAGWWSFGVSGRHATPKEEAETPDTSRLPSIRGHLCGDWLFVSGSRVERLFLMPEEEPPMLAPARGRRWHDGNHLFDSLEFESEAEEAARAALLGGSTTLEAIKGVTPSLRAAFGFAMLERGARERGLAVSARAVVGRVHAIATRSLSTAAVLDELEARRFQLDPTSMHRQDVSRATRSRTAATRDNVEPRIVDALAPTGADLLAVRLLGERNVEVVFRYLGEQFIAVVDWETLHVYDSGICLDGYDEMLGLDSLPSVIAEAVETNQLNITRR
jgi:hypothetical protein